LLLVGAALAFGFGVVLAVATARDAGRAAGPMTVGRPALIELGSTSCADCRVMQPVLAIAQRGANRLGRRASTGLRWARTTAGFLLVALAGWMTANPIMAG